MSEKTDGIEEVALPEAEVLKARLALMTLDRDKALLGAAEARMREAQASMTGIKAQLVKSQAAVDAAGASLVAALTENGKYELVNEQLELEAPTVKRRLKKG